MVFIKALGFVMPVFFFILEKIAEKLVPDQEKEYGYLSMGVTIVCWIYSFVNIFTDEVIFSVLLWLQNHWWVAGIYLLLAAVLPSIVA